MDVGIMGASPACPFFRKEDVLDFTDLELELEDQDKSFADELVEIEERMAGAALDLPPFKPDEDGKMMQLVSQKYIRALMKSPPLSDPLPVSVEALRCNGIKDEEELETVARSFRALESARDIQNDIIQQYRAKGYAYVALPEDYKRYLPTASGNYEPASISVMD